jgi:anaerobic C4-dicarboxylate transporter
MPAAGRGDVLMARRPAAERRLLSLWTAGVLAVLLVLGISWLGDWSLQWPVLLVPALWALAALAIRDGI